MLTDQKGRSGPDCPEKAAQGEAIQSVAPAASVSPVGSVGWDSRTRALGGRGSMEGAGFSRTGKTVGRGTM